MLASDVINNYHRTFDLKRSGVIYKPTRRVAIVVIASAVFALFVPAMISNLLSSLISAQAILVGFTFNVAFFLSSQSILSLPQSDSLEQQVEKSRLAGATTALFHIVTYYNVVTILSLAPALILLCPDIPTVVATLVGNRVPQAAAGARSLAAILSFSGFSVLLFLCAILTLESAVAFARAIARVSFVFDARVRLLNQPLT